MVAGSGIVRLMHRLDRRPSAEAEADYYRNRTGAPGR